MTEILYKGCETAESSSSLKDSDFSIKTVTIGTPEIIALIILKVEQGGFSIQ